MSKLSNYPDLVKLLHLEQLSTFPKDFRAVNAEVITTPGSAFAHTVTIAAGSSSGVRINAPVVSGGGLVGHVSNVFPDEAIVTLLSDTDSFVAARDLSTGVRGGVRTGTGGTLILDQVPKQDVVRRGDAIVTDGTRNARYPDIYPYGIPIGRVSSFGVTDTAAFLQVQVQPFANLGSLEAVGVLIPTKHRR
jgi:rod shape-determining protein MreC